MLDRPHSFRVLACCALLLALARPASADWQFAPFFGWEFDGNTSLVDLEFATDEHAPGVWGHGYVDCGAAPLASRALQRYVPGFFNDPKLHGQADVVRCQPSLRADGQRRRHLSAAAGTNTGYARSCSGGLGMLAAEADRRRGRPLPVHKTLFGGEHRRRRGGVHHGSHRVAIRPSVSWQPADRETGTR